MQPLMRNTIALAPLQASGSDDLSGQNINEITGNITKEPFF
jgi:hypothetical protein